MSHNHDHNHDHEVITLVDEQGNETLFEILLTIDGREEFGKNYVLLVPAGAEEDANGEIEIQAYSFTENEDGTEGDLQPIPEDSDAEWDMIEEVFNSFIDENLKVLTNILNYFTNFVHCLTSIKLTEGLTTITMQVKSHQLLGEKGLRFCSQSFFSNY